VPSANEACSVQGGIIVTSWRCSTLLLLLLLSMAIQEGVVRVALDWVKAVKGVTVILGPGSINGNALGQVRVGDEVAACRG
jgi:hypothetical protein